MELDDLKKQWKSTATDHPADAIKDAIEKKISKLERSGRGIARAFWIEMIVSWGMYVGFWIAMWYYHDLVESYMYKIVIMIGVAMIPIVWRLYRSMQWANSLDYSKDVRSNVVTFVSYYRKTLRFYEWGTYLISSISIAIMMTDSAFRSTNHRIQWTVIIYVIVVSLIARPYIHLVYGKKVAVFEDFLKD